MYRTNAYPFSSPRRSGSIALGVTAVVATSLLTLGSLGYVVYRLGAKHGAATAETATPPSRPRPASPTFVEKTESDDIAPAPTSFAASLAARPAWARDDDAYAPQLGQPLDAFVRTNPIEGPLEHAFVICRFQSFSQHDTFAGDDLHVRAKLGATPEVRANGPEDANLGFASAPLVSLKDGEKLRFEVYDRDVFTMPTITKATTPFAAPFNYVDDGAAIECRALAGAPLLDAVKTYGTRADAAIGKLASDRIDPYSPEWTADQFDQLAAQRATTDVAALAGWADPRTQRRVVALDAAIASIDAQRTQAFTTLHEAARDRVTFDRFDVALGAVDCDGDVCTVHLSVTNHDRRDTLHFGGFLSPFAYVADARSRPVSTTGGGDIPAGATQEIAVTSKGPHLTSGPSIAGICQGSRCAPLRVR